MSRHCLNCGHPVHGKYCSHCAQSTDLGRITWKSFYQEFLHGFTHVEKSIKGTLWELLKNPGRMLDGYLAGKRKKYQSPVGFFLVWITISIFLQQSLIGHYGFHPVYKTGITFSDPDSIKAFVKHGEWLYILCFPMSAAIFYFILGRPVYTYLECLVITMYAFSVVYVFHSLCYLIGGWLLTLNVLHWRFYLFQIIIALLYTVWACWSIFRHKKTKWLIPRVLLYLFVNAIITLKFLEWLSGIWNLLENRVQE